MTGACLTSGECKILSTARTDARVSIKTDESLFTFAIWKYQNRSFDDLIR